VARVLRRRALLIAAAIAVVVAAVVVACCAARRRRGGAPKAARAEPRSPTSQRPADVVFDLDTREPLVGWRSSSSRRASHGPLSADQAHVVGGRGGGVDAFKAWLAFATDAPRRGLAGAAAAAATAWSSSRRAQPT
jgi:hypothetical protein